MAGSRSGEGLLSALMRGGSGGMGVASGTFRKLRLDIFSCGAKIEIEHTFYTRSNN